MLHFIIGTKQSGKTTKAHEILGQCVRAGEEALLIVPKQYTFESDKRILHLLGPQLACEVEVLSFSRLVNTAMSRYGGIIKPVAKEGARVILMSLAIEALDDKLTVFAKHKNNFALIKGMLEAVDEFKRDGIDSDMLFQCAEKITDKTLKNKINETAMIYSAYESVVSQNYFDDADVLCKMAEVLGKTDYFSKKTVVLDGFSDFTHGEISLIEVMLKKCKDVYITLCSNDIFDVSETSAFSFVNKTARKLRRVAEKCSVEVKMPIVTERKAEAFSKEIDYLEKNLFAHEAEAFSTENGNVSVIVSNDIYKECDAVSRIIKGFLRKGEYRCRDFAVVFRNGDVYERLMKSSFKKYGIPYFDDRRQPVENQPIVSFVRSLLQICSDGFESDNIFKLVKTGLAGLGSDEISLVENYVFAWDINGKKWLDEWNYNPQGFGFELKDNDKELLSEINATREKIVSPLVSLKEQLNNSNGQAITETLYACLRNNKVDEALKNYAVSLEESGLFELAVEQEQVWDILMETFDEIACVLGKKAVSIKRYLEFFELIISSKSLGKLPDGFDEVCVSSAERILTKHARVVFAVGMNTGVFPLQQPSEGLISTREKEKLRNVGAKTGFSVQSFVQKEKFLLYSSLFSATEKLFVSYVTASSGGEILTESECIKSIRNLLPLHKEIVVSQSSEEELVESENAAFELMAKTWHENTPKANALKKYFSDKAEYKNRLEAIMRATEQKEFRFEDKNKSLKLFGKDMFFSASQMEVYYKCPFMYFCKYGIYAKPRLKARLDPAQSGTIVHYCLENILKKYEGREFLRLSDDEIKGEIKAFLSSYLQKEMGGEADKTERFNYLYSRTEKVLRHLISRLIAEFTDSDFEMCDFELRIDGNSQVKPIEIELDDGKVQIRGFVDRVDKLDVDGKRFIRVIDYKTGAKEFLLSDVVYGLNMQMLLYLVSITRSKEGFYKDSIPAGVLYFPANLKPCNAERGDSEETRKNKIYSVSKMNGMLVGDEAVISHMDKEKKGLFLPAKFDSKGTVKGNFISLLQFQKLGEYMDNLIKEMGNCVHSGIIPAKPAIGPDHGQTCEWCDYSEVCLREKGDYRFIESMKHDEALKVIMGGDEVEA